MVQRKSSEPTERQQNKATQATLQTLADLLPQVETLCNTVNSSDSQIRAVHQHVGDLKTSGELEESRLLLLREIASLLDSNQQLREDLDYAHLRLEEQAEELDRTRREARTDALSGLANRKAFDQRLRMLLGLWKREQLPFVLILADMDHLKWINDTHGHVAGDRVIQQIGKLLTERLREGDFVCRYGGDEFALLLPRTDLETGMEIAQRLRQETARANFGLGIRGAKAAVTFSCGVASPHHGDSPETLIQRADQALYVSKHSGRNRVQREEPSPAASVSGVDPSSAPLENGAHVNEPTPVLSSV
jgi:diguanylate cyclase